MEVKLAINDKGVLEGVEFDDLDGIDIDPDFEDIVDVIHRTAVEIPYSVTHIGDRAFYDKRWLSAVTIPESVLTIGGEAFSDCYYVESIILPKSVALIGRRAFAYCEGMTSITIANESALFEDDVFFGCTKELTIHAKKESSAEKYAALSSIRFEAI
jgi:hypothetical protein